ncbi:MAG: MEDS domain-containing protein [Sedimenticola sp.]|nr:MEDS domain-containing protein [Sedimenticola sp.]
MHIHTSDQEQTELGFYGCSCNWGTHICGLYHTEEERDEILYGFLHQGHKDGDQQLYVPTERQPEEFLTEYQSRYGEETATDLADETVFTVADAKTIYYPDGQFSPHSMDENLSAFYQQSQSNGRRNIRATAEMTWALDAIPGVEHLMVYESRLNYFIPGKPWISICLYNLNKFDGLSIMNVLRTHPFAISNGIITENPYYQKPEEWLRINAPQFL